MSRFLHPIGPSLVLASTIVLTACGGGGGGGSNNNGAPAPGTANVERYAIATAYNGDTLATYAVEPQSGLMRLVDKVGSINNATAVAIRPGHDEVMALTNGGVIYQYSLSTRGELDYMDFAITNGGALNDLAVHPSGNYVYVADGNAGIYQLGFDEDGLITLMEPEELVVSDNMDAQFTSVALNRSGKHLYAADIVNGISHFSVALDGTLTFEESILVDSAWQIVAHPNRDLLYAIERNDGSLHQFRILSNGSLESLATSPYLGGQLEGLTLDRSGNYLYISDITNDVIWQLRIGSNGMASLLDNPSIDVPTNTPRSLKASPASNRIYLADQNGSAMLAFSISSNGELSAMTPDRVAMDAYPTDLVFSTGPALEAHTTAAYVINGNSNNVSQFLMDDAGTLTPLGDTPPATGAFPQAIAAHPNGKSFYVANYSDNTVSQYRRVTSANLDYEVDELRAIQDDAEMDLGPAALVVHPSGNYLYVVCSGNDSVSTYKLQNNGEIVDNNGIGIYMPDDILLVDRDQFGFPDPSAIAIDPAGRYLWVSNNNNPGTVIAFQIDPTDGSLTKGDSTSAGNAPRAITVNADGTAVYITASGDNSIRRYSVAANGDLIYPAVQNIASDQYPASLVLAPKGNALYAANTLSSNVSQFSVANDGSLAAMNPASLSTGIAPQGMAIDPTGKNLLIANQASGDITRFSADKNGALTVEETLSVGINPQGISIVGYTE